MMMFQRLITSCSWALPLINLSLCTESEIANLGPKRAWQQAVGSTSKPTKKPSLDLYHDCPISLEFMNPGPSLLSSGQESQFVNHHDRIDRPNLGSDASWKGILHDCDVVSAPSNSWQPSEPGSSIDPMNSSLSNSEKQVRGVSGNRPSGHAQQPQTIDAQYITHRNCDQFGQAHPPIDPDIPDQACALASPVPQLFARAVSTHASGPFVRLFNLGLANLHEGLSPAESGPWIYGRLPLGTNYFFDRDFKKKVLLSCIISAKNHRVKRLESLKRSFQALIRWILYTHAAFSNHFKKSAEERKVQCQELFNWLNSALFVRSESPPIFGRVLAADMHAAAGGFGAVQVELINFLSLENSQFEAFLTSIAVLGIYYKLYHSGTWDRNFGTDERFVEAARGLVNKAIMDAKKVEDSFDVEPRSSDDQRLDGFPIYKLPPVLPANVHEKMTIIRDRALCVLSNLMAPGELENEILGKINTFYSSFPKVTQVNPGVICKDLPILIRNCEQVRFGGLRSENPDQNYGIRILAPLNKPIPLQTLLRRLEKFFYVSRYVHTEIYRILSLDRPGLARRVGEDWVKFLRWFSSAIFEPTDSMPIFGNYDIISEYEKVSQQFEIRPYFGSLQIYLIKNLSSTCVGELMVEFAVSLLGFWYFKENKQVLQSSFRDHQDYFETFLRIFA